MSPLWGFGIFVYAGCYKHVAPLGLNAAMHRNSRHCIHRRGEVTSSSGLGNPTSTASTSLCHLPIFPYPGGTCRPSGAKCGNAPKFKTLHPSSGRGHLVQRVGEPNPYAYNFACSPSNFHVSRWDLSPLWGFVVFGVCRVL